MKILIKSGLLASAAVVLAAGPASAQEGSEAAIESSVIVVTAQKRTERLLDVPVAVSAVSSESLISQNLSSVRDFYTRVPGIQLSGRTTQDISLRGISAGGVTNPTVAILIDDVPFGSSTFLGRPPIPDLDPAVLQRVEVLRGPQGTLYGASSLGGLIKYVTRDPSTTEWRARAEIGASTVADGGTGWTTRGSLNIPIVDDRIGATVSGFYRDDPRYIDSLTPTGATIRNANKNVVWGGRAALSVKATENFTITGSALIQRRDYAGSESIDVCSSCDILPATPTSVIFDARSTPNVRTALAAVVPGKEKQELYTARALLDLDGVQVVSISAWGHSDRQSTDDDTGTFGFLDSVYGPGGIYLFGEPNKTHKFSQEVRLSTSARGIDVLGGAFYTNERSSIVQLLDRAGTGPNVTTYAGSNLSTYKEMALFGDATVHLSEKLSVQVGGRYAVIDQTYRVFSVVDGPAQAIFGPGEDELFKASEKAFTWLVTPTYKFTPDMMVFARIASGYRPGGPNTQTPGAARTFGKDTVINYEIGFKGQFFDRRLTLDTSIFQIDWDDIQLQNTALPSQFVFFENGKKARSRGLEFAGSYRPWSGMTIDTNATILEAELTQTLDRSTATVQRLRGVAGERLPFSAKTSFNIGAQQDFPIAEDLVGYVGFNVSYVGNRMGLFNQDSAQAAISRVKLPAYTAVDLRGGLEINDRWKINIFAKNLFDKKGVVSGTTGNGTRLPEAVFIPPRTIGAILSVEM